MRVFLVDDSTLVRVRLAAMLQDLWEVDKVIEAGTVAEAMQLLPESRADMVVVDVRLPDGDGLSIVGAAKRLRPPPAIVVLTNYAYAELRKSCLEAGADEFLDKRTEFDRLPGLVTKWRRPDKP